ncbi:MAG: hypothetical protein ACI9LX_000681, partial [Paraglaciecola sp.]
MHPFLLLIFMLNNIDFTTLAKRETNARKKLR